MGHFCSYWSIAEIIEVSRYVYFMTGADVYSRYKFVVKLSLYPGSIGDVDSRCAQPSPELAMAIDCPPRSASHLDSRP
jgi:hypothetical protein